ncbi:MAG TPA: alpha-E domain-containing protein, partial [Opitutales bacterium]|nr:alpha-E domain-containing protein [Opitutales bacterium]
AYSAVGADEAKNDFFEHVKEFTILFQGTTDTIFPHNVGFEFIKCGNFIERADKIARILDTKYFLTLPNVSDVGGAMDAAGWVTLLRACSGREAYQRMYVQDITARNVAEQLLLSRVFPRSVFYSVHSLQNAMHAISGCPITHYSNEAERLVGRLVSDLSYTSIEEVLKKGLHETISELTDRIDNIAVELCNRYMFFPIVDPAAALAKKTDASRQIQTSQT